MLNILSLGAGVQSSTVFLMSCRGLLPKLDAAIFADTQWEPPWVYDWLDNVLEPEAKKAGIPLYRVTNGSVREGFLESVTLPPGPLGRSIVSIPAYTLDGPDRGILPRNCTRDYKITMIERKVRELWGEQPRTVGCVSQWMGISGDELRRLRTSRTYWIMFYYPLVLAFARPWHRHDCVNWLAKEGFPSVGRSACLGCPYHSDEEWRAIKQDPQAWSDVVAFDAAIRDSTRHNSQLFLHAKRIPLPMIDFETPEEKGQQNWLDECEGMCGV